MRAVAVVRSTRITEPVFRLDPSIRKAIFTTRPNTQSAFDFWISRMIIPATLVSFTTDISGAPYLREHLPMSRCPIAIHRKRAAISRAWRNRWLRDKCLLTTSLLALRNNIPELFSRRLHLDCSATTDAELIETCIRTQEDSGFFDVIDEMTVAAADTEQHDIDFSKWWLTNARRTLVYDCSV